MCSPMSIVTDNKDICMLSIQNNVTLACNYVTNVIWSRTFDSREKQDKNGC